MSDVALKLTGISKFYKLYNAPKDRLKEALHPLGKRYHKEFYALKDINLEIKKGEVLGVVGKNGSGKSTLLKVISGVLSPTKGEVFVNGKISALLELGSGFNPEFTGLQNIYFYGTILGFSRNDMEEKIDDIIAFADLGDFINQPLKTYSSGMKSRLGFAVAVHVNPDILILDEVLAVGDVLFKRKCYAKMEEFFQSGKTILYVSHDLNSVIELCRRSLLIESGNILLDADSKTVTTYYQKLMFSTGGKHREIISEIDDFSKKGDVNRNNYNNKSVNLSDENSNKKMSGYYLPNFSPKSKVEYRYEDIDIYEQSILNIDGEKCNVLVYGKKYVYKVNYKSNLEYPVNNISFGVDIKDEKGRIISTIESMRSNKNRFYLNCFRPKQVVEFRVEFICLFSAGNYFINSGLSSYESGSQKILNRIIDISCFKVANDNCNISGGIVNVFLNASFDGIAERDKYDCMVSFIPT